MSASLDLSANLVQDQEGEDTDRPYGILEPVVEEGRRLWQRVAGISEGGYSCSPLELAKSVDCSKLTTIRVPEDSRLARFATREAIKSKKTKKEKKEKKVEVDAGLFSEEMSGTPKASDAVSSVERPLTLFSDDKFATPSGSYAALGSGVTGSNTGSRSGSGTVSLQASADGIDEEGNMTPGTRATAVEAMHSVFQRVEFTPRSERVELDEDELRRLHNSFLDAARAGNFRLMVQGLVAGADVDCRTLRGQNALMLASGARNKAALQVIAFLLEVKVNPESAAKGGWTPLLYACRNNIAEAAEMLIKSKGDVGSRSLDGQTAAMLAAKESGDDLVMRLIGYKVGLEKTDRRGWTLLFYAVENGRESLVKWLLKKKANADARSKDKTTCLMLAAEGGFLGIAKSLVEKNANVNVKNVMGNTALLLSVMNVEEKFASYLLDQQADCIAKNKDGQTAMMIAGQLRLGWLKNTLDVMARKAQDRGKAVEEDEDDV